MDRKPHLIDLALQGGGSHGAFTWGVLDRFLDEKSLRIDGISGTSAGAMNAAVLAHGYIKDGAAGARVALEEFWRSVSHAGRFSPLQRSPIDVLLGRWTLDNSPMFVAMDMMARLVSPYSMNPLGTNPLRDILAQTIDFSRLSLSPIKLFITATNVHSGRGRVFRKGEITPDVLLASACLPTLYQAIEIDGEPYWDGGYTGNPTVTPLVRECDSLDTVLVQINPVQREGTPRSARDILDRLNEVTCNSVLIKELRMIALMKKAFTKKKALMKANTHPVDDETERWAAMRIHRVASDIMLELNYSSKLNAEWAFLAMLRDKGRAAADEFLGAHRGDLGRRSTLDLDMLLNDI